MHHGRSRGTAGPERDPRPLMRYESAALAQIAGAVALMVAAVWVATQLPLFGGTGIGQDIALFSCVSGTLLALSVLIGWVRHRRAHDERSGPWEVMVGIIFAVVALSACLDALAVLEYLIHK